MGRGSQKEFAYLRPYTVPYITLLPVVLAGPGSLPTKPKAWGLGAHTLKSWELRSHPHSYVPLFLFLTSV